ncbi:MAG: type II toxin-antitoxin system HicA family toxin [Armatimonadota bacterium]
MTPHLPAVTAAQLIRAAVRLGFRFDRQKGSHAVYFREEDKARIVVPVHSGKELKPKTLLGILQDMGLSIDEFRSLL